MGRRHSIKYLIITNYTIEQDFDGCLSAYCSFRMSTEIPVLYKWYECMIESEYNVLLLYMLIKPYAICYHFGFSRFLQKCIWTKQHGHNIFSGWNFWKENFMLVYKTPSQMITLWPIFQLLKFIISRACFRNAYEWWSTITANEQSVSGIWFLKLFYSTLLSRC